MGQLPSTEAGQANEVDGDGPWKRDSNQRFTNRGQGETNVVVSQPLPNQRETNPCKDKPGHQYYYAKIGAEPTSPFSWRLIKNAKF